MSSVTNKICNYFLFGAIYLFIYGHAAYFSMSNIFMNLPGDKSKYPQTDHSILTLYALRDIDSDYNQPEHFVYSVHTLGEPLVQVFRPTGDVMFKKAFFEKDVTNVTLQASVEDNTGMRDTTTIQLNIGPQYPLNCDLILQDLCFWQSATYRLFENRKPTIIGSLNSPYIAEMCKGYKINYTLLEGGNQFDVVTPSDINKSWEIRSLKSLDRDVNRSMSVFSTKSSESGEYRYLSVKCSVENPLGKIQHMLKNISIKILDEDDNLPATRIDEFVSIQLSSNVVNKEQVIEHKDLMFVDRDSPPVNEYSITVTEDELGIFEPNCTIYEDDREEEPHTAIFCKLIATKDIRLPESPYTLTLEINDTTLLPGFGKSLVRVPIRIYFEKYGDFSNPLALTMPPTDLSHPLLLYPSREVTIFRTAAPLARVTQPIKANLQKSIKSFVILNDSKDAAFGITATDGIVHVKNITTLRKLPSHVRLTVQWINKKMIQKDEIVVIITNEPNHKCHEKSEDLKNWDVCSYYKSKKDCNKACGISTGGSPGVERRKNFNNPETCMWRGDPHPGNETTNIYATCTPDTITCPDGICDSLEKLSALVCPQDCTANVLFPTERNPTTRLGIEKGAGVCFCNPSGGCLCEFVAKKNKPKPITTKAPDLNSNFSNSTQNFTVPAIVQSNVSRRTGVDVSTCGTKCILGITGSGLILIAIISGMVICFRVYRKRKPVREKFSNDATDLSVPLSDYVDRTAPSESLHFNFDISTLTYQINRAEPDPKWEFPRNQLKIEQTLGEGEFGRVLRAQALNIGGQTGYTTVAVKTLKTDAGERELADLLSEYQLLKEVSHPNIIKLLGASTVPGGPVYLIIEFAEYGSLRNYLRRSRHLQTDLHIQSNPLQNLTLPLEHYDEPKTCDITPQEILSFAWQIANGMAYLSDIKLVHRDLAARNILLAVEKVCKISDFGLTRDIYQDDAYFKRSKGRVPIKWMAPESLSDHVYTNKSDVWSFGILIWELVTLGASPYPGIVVQSLFHLLKTGYRMERPENCSVALYKVMRSCWSLDPDERPTFSELSMRFEKMLGDKVEYLDLTSNAINNRGYFCDTLEDIEVEVEDDKKVAKSNTEAINYLNKTIDYEKCGNATKINVPCPEEEKIENDELLPTPQRDMQNSIGYETPIKLQNKSETSVTTPLNEFPQYGYTDMNACKPK